MSTAEILELIIQALIFLGILYVAFFKSYFQEKGKNLATKEDIQEITSLVESVKTKLQYSLQAKIVLSRDEHESLLHYYSCLSKWIHSVSNYSFAGITYDTIHVIYERLQYVNTYHSETLLAFTKVELLVDNDILREEGHKLISEVLKYQERTVRMCGDYHLLCLEIHADELRLRDGGSVEDWAKVLAKQQIAIQEYYKEQVSVYGILLTHTMPHMKTISAHLKYIIRNSDD